MTAFGASLKEIITALSQDEKLYEICRALFALREGTAIEIARQAGLPVEVAYEKLCRLEELGLAKVVPISCEHEEISPARHYYLSAKGYANRRLLAAVA